MNRRDFLKVSAAAGGALAVNVALPGCVSRSPQVAISGWRSGRDFVPNAWVKIAPTGQVTLRLQSVEMGQGTMTSHAQLLAEELEVDPTAIEVEFAPADRVYDNSELGFQITGGSTSVLTAWKPLRRAGAVAREMLKGAAAEGWGVPRDSCEASLGVVHHRSSARQASYGSLVEAAARMSVPAVRLKSRASFKVIGKPVRRIDARMKVDGSARFGIDVMVPNMLNAVVIRSPVPGGSLRGFSAADALAQNGVRHVVAIPSGVAVVADHYWQARTAAARVAVQWNEGPLAGFSTEGWRASFAARARKSAKKVRAEGSISRGFARATKILDAEYEAPYVAHAAMEPVNCTAHVQPGRCDIWAPTQSAGLAREVAVAITGLPYAKVRVHQTLIGGGFGRRIPQDYVSEAVELSRRIARPVKIIWSREDDLENDFYRPATYNVLRGGVDENGNLVAWFHRLVGQSIVSQVGPAFVSAMLPNGMPRFVKRMGGSAGSSAYSSALVIDTSAVEGASDFAYAIPHIRVEYAPMEPGVPVGFWRSVGHSENAFFVESFVDELAHLAGRDPYEFRRALLAGAPRNLAVLDLAATKAGWQTPPARGTFRGIAQHKSFGTYCAQVAEVSVVGRALKLHRVVCAVDCGLVINPDIVKAQIEGAIVFGLSAALKQAITFKHGRVQETNFHRFKMLRMFEMPKIEVYIVASSAEPTGVGEPGVPPIAPAVANAIFRATGRRLRRLPLEPELERP